MDTATTDRTDGLTHRRAVVLHADVVDYSRLLADDPAATVETMRAYQKLVAVAVADAGGTLVNFVGDSFLAVFDDAASGMRAAMRICAEVRARNADVPRTRQAWFRLGLDAGEVVAADDGRHFGDPLNIAARIQALAEIGGINVTQAVYTELDEPALRLIDTGARRLKNIPEPVRVYRLADMGRGVEGDVRPPTPPTPTVVVLPVHHADDPVTREVAEALRLELVDALGALAGLRVVDHREVRGEVDRGPGTVDASYALHSGVVRSGTRLRAYATLGEIETMNRAWGGRWEGSTGDVFALQDRMANAVVRAMEVELVVGEPAILYRSSLDARARGLVYQGWHHFRSGTPEGWRRARELFLRVRDDWPDGVTGYALSAFVCWWGAMQRLSPTPAEDLEVAAAAAARGAELGDPTGLSHMVTAALRLEAGEDLGQALEAAQAALELRPTCDVSFAVLGSVQRYLGEWEAAVESCRRAFELSPVRVPWFATVQASAYYVGERYHEAARLAEQVVDRQPDNREALQVLAASQQALGLHRRARAAVELLRERHPGTTVDDLPRRHPFRDPEIIERWTAQLSAAGLS
jgi:adenylate cyclase